MSYIEEILMEAWELGIKDQVIERVKEKQKDLTFAGKHIDRESIYDQAMLEIKKEIAGNGSGN